VGRVPPDQTAATDLAYQSCTFLIGSYKLSQCCESSSEERIAGNLHATFCGNRGRATASGDPVVPSNGHPYRNRSAGSAVMSAAATTPRTARLSRQARRGVYRCRLIRSRLRDRLWPIQRESWQRHARDNRRARQSVSRVHLRHGPAPIGAGPTTTHRVFASAPP
jgi:hypothetical protein